MGDLKTRLDMLKRSFMPEPLCYTLTDAGRLLSISLRTLQRRIASGDVEVKIVLGMPRITRNELERLIARVA